MGTNIHLRFPAGISTEPVVCNLTRLFDLDFNITTAQISERREGFLNLRSRGVEVTPVAQRIRRDESECVECGVCTAICPTAALHMDDDRRLVFDKERCTVCTLCTRVCPVQALQVDSEG